MSGIGDAENQYAASISKSRPVRTPKTRRLIQQHIDATDREMDTLVYELCGLTEHEIRIVEEAAR